MSKTQESKTKKVNFKPGTMLYPAPAAIISCGIEPKDYNLITISWIGTICSDPPMLSISVRPERHSYNIIRSDMQFVVNLTTKKMVRATDFCGVRSGKKLKKWDQTRLVAGPSKVIKVPQIESSPVSIECVVKQIIPLGSHDMFIAEVVNVSVDQGLIDKKGKFHLEKANLISYVHGSYMFSEKQIGKFGYSVKKAKRR